MEKRLRLVLACLFLSIGMAMAQTKVTGTVVSQDDGEPIVGASVVIVDDKGGTVTDINGHFTITVPKGKKLKITYIGMKEQVLLPKEKMTIIMVSGTNLQEVVVTGMSKVDRRTFTGATDKVDAASAMIGGLPDISRSLEGRSAGVSVQNLSGTFGTAPKIRVRGATSIYGSSKPLWVVDGVIMEDVTDISADALSSGDAETLISSAIAGLNSDDIESFQILKDGSATSIYGARAMAGVIVVTTKKGKQGQAHLNYTGEFTTRLIPSYSNFNILNSQDQMSIYKEMREKGWFGFSDLLNGSDYGVYGHMFSLMNTYDPKTKTFALGNNLEDEYAHLGLAEMRNTDWFKELFSSAIMQNHSVSLSGGTAKSNYYASLSAMVDPGWYKKSNVNRYTANLNVTHHITDKISLNIIGSGSYRKQSAPGTLGQDVDVVNGQVKRDFDINPYSYALNSSRALDPNTYYQANYAPFNILHELESNYIDLNVTDVKFQGELKYRPIEGLELSALGAIKYASTSQENKIGDNSNQALAYRAMGNSIIRDANKFLYKDPEEPYALPMSVLPNGGFYQRTDNRMNSYDFRMTANYNKTFAKKHMTNLFAGMELNSIERSRSWFSGVGMQYKGGEVPYFVPEYFKKLSEENSDYYNLRNTRLRSVAYFANITYSFDGKYNINGTIRYEGSNKLGKVRSARWLPTWNISGSWNVHEETFFKHLRPAMSHLTLKASYSLTADRGPADYTNSTAIFKGYTPYRPFATDKEASIDKADPQNGDLTYEKKHEFNFGVDMGFLNNRISVGFDIYTRNNYDLIGALNTTSWPVLQFANVAEMKSHGEELSISTTNIKKKDFSWTSSLIFSHAVNEITSLKNRARVMDLVAGSGFAREGYPVRALFSVPFQGLNESGIPTFTNEKGVTTVGDINLQNRDNNSYLVYEGPTDPTVTGSLGNIFSYKGFRLNLFVTYSFGNVIRMDPVFSAKYNDLTSMTKEFNNRWVNSGDEAYTNIPAIINTRQYKNIEDVKRSYNVYNYSTVRIAKGDFIRMKEVSLSYDCPKSWFAKGAVKSLSMKLQATNLFLIYADKKLNGQDPEFFRSGGVSAPVPKQLTFTVKVGL